MKGFAIVGFLVAVLNFVHGGEVASCAGEDLLTCVGLKAAVALDRAARQTGTLELLPGFQLVGEPSSRAGRALVSESQLEASLPKETEARQSRLLEYITETVTDFLKTHSISIKAPEGNPESWARALDEGRARLKKKMLPILLLVGAKLVALLPLAIGLVGLMALKALFVGKLAFIIAAVIAFQKFFSGGSGAALTSFVKQSPEAWNSGSSGGWSSSGSGASGGPYYRSFDAHDLAYSAQQPNQIC